MPTSMKLIQTVTVGAGGAASIDFTGIPQTGFTDLMVVLSWNSSGNDDSIFIQFNGSTTGYNKRNILGFGSGSPISQSFADSYFGSNKTTTASTFNSGQIYIPNYAGSANKSFSSEDVSEANAAGSYANLTAGLWSSTAAITSIKLDLAAGNFVQYSTASLYGVTSVAPNAKATGGEIYQINGYTCHVFTTSGTFTPTTNLTNVDYLVIAGGGAGAAYRRAGGGGAGGYRSSVTGENSGGGAGAETKLSLTSGTPYTVVVGAGGGTLSSGSNSSFAGITAIGGGCGGYGGTVTPATAPGLPGGSGGGGSGDGAGAAGGTGTANQGFNGGAGSNVSNGGGGGGGGAAVAGAAGTSTTGGNGGNGVYSTITGSSVARAGGGGGGVASGQTAGSGGVGGGGSGVLGANVPNPGLPNTGSGGGGRSTSNPPDGGGNGGSGIVIVRYAN